MAISGDDVQFCIYKSIKFSINSGWDFAKNHPFVSCTMLLFSFLYACFPWFFWALIHLLAFLILVGSITRIYSTSQSKKSPVNNKNSNIHSLGSVDTSKQYALNVRNGKTIVRAQSVRQRKSRETSRNSPLQNSKDEKITVSSSTFNNDMVDKSPLEEENPKEIGEVKVDKGIRDRDEECCGGLKSFQESQKFVSGGEIESESSEDDEKEREENNKAIQWTEDDEKNLMDLGFSEIERNKRLESLIARGRGRKLLSLQIRRTLSKDTSLIAPIAIPNNMPFSQHHTIGQLSPTPGSAPSVLLPAHDPFDLPYDPQEEKPVLTSGSFQQESIAPEPKDALFCRHVSFSLGDPHLMDFKQETWPSTNNHRAPESLGNSDTGNQLEGKDTDKVIEIESCQSPKSNLKGIKADDCITEEIQNFEKGRVSDDVHEEHQNTDIETKPVVMHHKPTNSIASDLQVEVSEVSSPAQTIDGSISSLDIGSPIEEEDVTSDITYGNEATWETSSQPSRNDDADSKLKEMHKPHEENPMKLGFSRSEESKDILVPHELAKNIKEQDFTDSILRPASKDELLNSSQEHISDFQMEVKENFQKPTLQSSQSSTSGISAFPVFENVQQSTEKQMPRHFQTLESGIRETDAEVDPLNKKGGAEPGEMTQISTSMSFGLIGSQQEEKENHPNIPDPRNKQIDENDASKVPKDTQSESQKQEPMDEPMSIEDKNTVESTQANEGGEHTNEERFPGVNVSFSYQALELHPRPVLQEVSMSSEISSPRSVLQPKLSMDRSSLSNTTEDMHAEIQQLYTQIVENNMPEEERATSAIPPSGTVLRENSTSRPLLDGLEGKVSQESSHPSSSAMQANSLQFASKSAVAEDAITQNETREIPECTTEKINSPVDLVDLQKPVQETNPSTLDEINGNSDEHYKHEVSPAMDNPNEQLNESTQLVNREESSHLSKSMMEVNSLESSAAEDERIQDKAMEIPDSTATRMSNANMTAGPQKLIEEETNPSTLGNTIDKSKTRED